MMKRFLPRATTLVLGMISVIPFVTAITLYGVGMMGPTLLYMSSKLTRHTTQVDLDWRGLGALPPRVWQTMRVRSQKVRYDDDSFWGGLGATHGETMLATGREGVAIAHCHAPGERGRKYGGYLRGWVAFPHFVIVLSAALLSVYCFLTLRCGPLFWWRWLRRRSLIPEGHCRQCGYNLYGLAENRCPECGAPIPNDNDEPEPTSNPRRR